MNIYEEWSSFRNFDGDISGTLPDLSQMSPYLSSTKKVSRLGVELNGKNLKDLLVPQDLNLKFSSELISLQL
jgi:hypothetical protein